MSKKPQLLFWICVLSTMAAIGAHIYLTNHHYEFKYGSAAAEGLCNINETFNCNKTTISQYSEVFGVPIAVFGGLVNFVLLCLLLGFRFPILKTETQIALTTPIKLFTLGIFLVSLVMGSISYFGLNTICPMCSATYLFSFISFVTAWLYFDKGLQISGLEFKLIPGLAIAILIFGFFFHHNNLRKFGGKEVQEFARLQLEEWRSYPTKEFTPVSPITMNASSSAKIKIVEFADFLCGHCAKAFPIIHNFAKSHPDVEFSFQAFPLDGECNSVIPRSTGIQCMLARVSHCANEQGKAWETQKWIFENQRDLLGKEAINKKLDESYVNLGLNKETLLACLDDEKTRTAIKAQADLGTQVGIRGTPALFINGKKVPSGFSIPLLERIYREVK